MPLDFPASPSLNDTYSFGGKTWIWNGSGWALKSSGAINDIPIGNITASTGNFTTLESTSFTSTGNVTGANLVTAGDVTTATVTASGNVTGGNLVTAGDVTTDTVTATGNVTGGNVNATTAVTAVDVIASGNVDGANVNTDSIVGTAITITGTSVTMDLTGNLNMGGRYINAVADPAAAKDAATKQYVDDSVSAGIHIHDPVQLETPVALPAATYAQGGTVYTVTDTVAGNTVVFSTAANLQPNDQLWFSSSFEGIVANISYFVVSAPNTSAAVLTTAYDGVPVSNITSNTGLSESVRVNSGIGATLTATANGALTVDSVAVGAGNRILVYQQSIQYENGVYTVTDTGNATAPWILTRATDSDQYAPDTNDGMDSGSYYFVQSGDTGAGESYVLTSPQLEYIIGFDSVEFTQFSASQVYSANTQAGLDLSGTVFSAKVDDDTTAFDGGGNIQVKAGANLVTPNIGDATGNSLTLDGNGLLSATTVTATGNVTAGTLTVNGESTFAGNLIPAANITYDLGSDTERWNDLWLANSTIYIGNGSISANTTSLVLINPDGSTFEAGGGGGGITWTTQANTAPSSPNPGDFWYDSFTQVKFQYINDGTGNVWVDQSSPTTFGTISVTGITNNNSNAVGNIGTSGGYFGTAFIDSVDSSNITATGNVTGGNIITSGLASVSSIVKTGSNGVGNIGQVDNSFDTVFAKATSAQYADLAEIYQSDQHYDPGTVVVFGGTNEITASSRSHDTRIAGVISTQPAFLMNDSAPGLPVALVGRVPCRVLGPVSKGDVLVASDQIGIAQRIKYHEPGCVIGKALEDLVEDQVQTIEIVVGRF